jgi:hypothetical protein
MAERRTSRVLILLSALAGAALSYLVQTLAIEMWIRPAPGLSLFLPVPVEQRQEPFLAADVLSALRVLEEKGSHDAAVIGRTLAQWCRNILRSCEEKVKTIKMRTGHAGGRIWEGERLHDEWIYIFCNETPRRIEISFIYIAQSFDPWMRQFHWLRQFVPTGKVLRVDVDPGQVVLFQPTLSGRYNVEIAQRTADGTGPGNRQSGG